MGLGLIAAMTAALERRGAPKLTAHVAAELGTLALGFAYERWGESTNHDDFGDIAQRTLGELHAASAQC